MIETYSFLYFAVATSWLAMFFVFLLQRAKNQVQAELTKAQIALALAQAARLEAEVDHMNAHIEALKIQNAIMQRGDPTPPEEIEH